MTDKRIRIIFDSREAEKNARSLDKAVTGAGESADHAQFAVNKLAGAIAGAFAADRIISFFQKSVQAFADFERGLIGVGKTTNIEGEALQELGQQIQGLTREIPLAATELLGIAQAAGQLGVSGTDNIVKFTATIGKLGLASDLAGEQAASTLARILTVTGTAVEEVDRLGSTIVQLGNNFAATEAEIADVATRVAQSTVQFNVSAANVLGISTALKAVGIQAELGGTQVGLAFQAINDALRNGGEEMKALQKITGETGEELKAAFFGGESVAVFEKFINGLSKIQDAGGDVSQALERMGLTGTMATTVLATLASRSAVLEKALKFANKEWEDNIALNKEAATAATSFSSQMQIVKNAADEAAVAIGAIIAPNLLDSMSALRDASIYVAENIDTISEAAEILSVIIGARLTTAIAASVAALYQKNIATIASLKAEQDLAFGIARRADAEKLAAAALLKTAQAELAVINAKVQSIRQIQLHGVYAGDLNAVLERQAIAQARVSAATIASAEASGVAVAANARLAASSAAVTRATTLAGVAARSLQGAMALLGGPMGVAIMAASALVYYATSATEAKTASDILSQSIDKLHAKQAAAQILEANEALKQQKEIIDDLTKAMRANEQRAFLAEMNNANPDALIEFKNAAILLDRELYEAQQTAKALEDRLKALGDIVLPKVDLGFDEKAIGDAFETTPQKPKEESSPEFLKDIEKVRQNTKELENELKLRNKLSAIYRQEEIDAAKSSYEKERVELQQSESAKIAQLKHSHEIESAERTAFFEKALKSEKLSEEERAQLRAELLKQETSSKLILETQLTQIHKDGIEARKQIDLDESKSGFQVQQMQAVTAQLQRELEIRKNISGAYSALEVENEWNKYDILKQQAIIQQEEEKARAIQKYTDDTTNRTLQFEELMASMIYENETKIALRDEFNQQEILQKQLLEEELSAIEKEAAEKRKALARLEAQAKLQIVQSAGTDLMNLAQGHSKKAFELGKIAARSSAAISGGLAAVDAWKSGMATGGPWAPLIAAGYTAASLLKTGNLIKQINSQQFGGGASISSGGGGVSIPTTPSGSPGGESNSGNNSNPGLPERERETPRMQTLVIDGLNDEGIISTKLLKTILKYSEESWKAGEGIGRYIFRDA